VIACSVSFVIVAPVAMNSISAPERVVTTSRILEPHALAERDVLDAETPREEWREK